MFFIHYLNCIVNIALFYPCIKYLYLAENSNNFSWATTFFSPPLSAVCCHTKHIVWHLKNHLKYNFTHTLSLAVYVSAHLFNIPVVIFPFVLRHCPWSSLCSCDSNWMLSHCSARESKAADPQLASFTCSLKLTVMCHYATVLQVEPLRLHTNVCREHLLQFPLFLFLSLSHSRCDPVSFRQLQWNLLPSPGSGPVRLIHTERQRP